MSDATAANTTDNGPVLAADGTPLKRSLARALRVQKMRALLLIAPLLIFIMVAFIAPIVDMLFRSVENQITSETLPRTVMALEDWDPEGLPDEDTYAALTYDFVEAAERRIHTRLGSRLNYETTGISSLFRQSGRGVDDIGEDYADQFIELNPAWEEADTWAMLMGAPDWIEAASAAEDAGPSFRLSVAASELLPETADAYRGFARTVQQEDNDNPMAEEPWFPVYMALYRDLMRTDVSGYDGPMADLLIEADAAVEGFTGMSPSEAWLDLNDDWGDRNVWATIEAFSDPYTAGYFLTSIDLRLTPDGIEAQPEEQRIYLLLFQRTIFMSGMITLMCVLLGYPIAYLLSNLPSKSSNLLLILVLLPFWTSLLVRTSAWKVLLQQQGVINDILVWIGIVADENRLALINNQLGTIIAMTHILLPFMILPLYSVMKTIPPSYVRAAKSLGATNFTAFRRVYFPQSIPGIGAGCILVFILAIGYYITPELVGGRTGTFISNRIAYHISSSLNWGLAAALGSILLALVLVLYWLYDRIVGIDNVKLG
ncbi:ABC transporter permease [Gymnodinialimonas ceratoperidinii]|uniref:ABC transporter permease n=1 Tax=Gymnodinialimonas ceratoperidinii TaxID=2856823 RepID=A0A8F6TWA2_9RHOB|nr:ABC transporter permease [Gymnodinialimonas ceratoperidinii]QXT39089.1 ABC transporter permease [Gymnodinialimonas ceratoperidinii]